VHPGEPSLPESLSIVIVIIGSKRRAGIAASCARRSSDMLRCFVHCATVPWYRHHHLRPIEIPKAVFLERVRWTAENGSFVRHPLEGGGGDGHPATSANGSGVSSFGSTSMPHGA